jgi:hypothetical protein
MLKNLLVLFLIVFFSSPTMAFMRKCSDGVVRVWVEQALDNPKDFNEALRKFRLENGLGPGWIDQKLINKLEQLGKIKTWTGHCGIYIE